MSKKIVKQNSPILNRVQICNLQQLARRWGELFLHLAQVGITTSNGSQQSRSQLIGQSEGCPGINLR